MDLPELRKAIDDADEIILRAIAARFAGIEHLKIVKGQRKLPVEDLKREEQIRNRWKKRAAELGIREELALVILDFLLSESKRLQST